MPRVLNKKVDGVPEGAVYVGRPSKWGNPFAIGKDGDRRTVIKMHLLWIFQQPELMAQLHELKGKDLVCWCAPLPCHADTLMRLANEDSSST